MKYKEACIDIWRQGRSLTGRRGSKKGNEEGGGGWGGRRTGEGREEAEEDKKRWRRGEEMCQS